MSVSIHDHAYRFIGPDAMSVTSLPSMLTVGELADIAQVSTWTIRKEIKDGRLLARRIGRVVRILDTEAARWMTDYAVPDTITATA